MHFLAALALASTALAAPKNFHRRTSCQAGVAQCAADSKGWEICDVSGAWVHAGHCGPSETCSFNSSNGSPFCAPLGGTGVPIGGPAPTGGIPTYTPTSSYHVSVSYPTTSSAAAPTATGTSETAEVPTETPVETQEPYPTTSTSISYPTAPGTAPPSSGFFQTVTAASTWANALNYPRATPVAPRH